ncbi:MAG TPA: GNAT family N-acetyltransferase [Acidimicrobiales bacterium]|nr:GNAT family N-acetyltransferase [Acidimicrobiales bacterium]
MIRSAELGDRASVLSLNEAAIPAVTPMSVGDFDYYAGVAEHFVVIGDGAGFLILIGPGVADYESPNYRWFSGRYDDFLYVDRIVVAEGQRGSGLGRSLYDFAVDRAGPRPVLAEVNLRPRNDVSLVFHEAFGFEQVGAQQVEGGAKEVAMLCRPAIPAP